MKTKFLLSWPKKKAWVLGALEELVRKKKQMGFDSSVTSEIVRIVEHHLTDVFTSKKSDMELLKEFRNSILGYEDETK
jgi:demethoxyubiquinone hydroxylase (CLK1/Coq7/Cat5 family)